MVTHVVTLILQGYHSDDKDTRRVGAGCAIFVCTVTYVVAAVVVIIVLINVA